MKTIVTYFLQGLLYLTPITVTGYALYWSFTELDQLLGFSFTGVGILIMLLGVTLVGFIGSFLIKLPFFHFLDHQLEQVPFIKTIYTSVKDMLKAAVGQKQGFNRPVLVKMGNDTEIRRLGFVTDEGLKFLKMDQQLITVYVPFSISFSGQLFLVPPHYLQPVAAKSSEIMKYVMAGGVTSVMDDLSEEHSVEEEKP